MVTVGMTGKNTYTGGSNCRAFNNKSGVSIGLLGTRLYKVKDLMI